MRTWSILTENHMISCTKQSARHTWLTHVGKSRVFGWICWCTSQFPSTSVSMYLGWRVEDAQWFFVLLLLWVWIVYIYRGNYIHIYISCSLFGIVCTQPEPCQNVKCTLLWFSFSKQLMTGQHPIPEPPDIRKTMPPKPFCVLVMQGNTEEILIC